MKMLACADEECSPLESKLGQQNTVAKTKIAIIGGGVGAITTAFAITQTPEWSDKYDLTIHQLGWRLGGKGASGRNADYGYRIEEHGLHLWAGFYDNAFRNMRRCYELLITLGLRSPDQPLATLDQAFKPLPYLFLAENVPAETGSANPWRPWLINLPTNDRQPGTETHVPGPFAMLRQMIAILVNFHEGSGLSSDGDNGLGIHLPPQLLDGHRAIRDHAHAMRDDPRRHSQADTNLLGELIAAAQELVKTLETPEHLQKDSVRRGLMLVDIGLAFMRGMVTRDTFVSGYDILDQWEFSEWLRLNGASEWALNSAPIRGCYNFVFGYPHGDPERAGDVGAGTAIRAMTRLLFTYSGSIFFKMQAGMGDTIFAPYYLVLRELGVKFEFFSAARELHLNPDKTCVESLTMVRQAEIKTGAYDPLIPVQDLPCWPSEPLWDQLVDGEALRTSGINFESEYDLRKGQAHTLQRGRDFDIVVLGASIASLPPMTRELSRASERWRTMLDRVETVGTQAAQLWLTKDAKTLGWDERVAAFNSPQAIPAGPLETVIDGFAEPLDTWADMSHLLAREDWGTKAPAMVGYFCAAAPDHETLPTFEARSDEWMDSKLPLLWPGSAKGGTFDQKLLYQGKAAGLYRRVNMLGSERYVLSVTGSVFHRLAPDESGFDNLVLAGDWTRCGLNAGCVEAATMSGIAAASAVTGVPLPIVGGKDVAGSSLAEQEALFLTNSISGTHWPLTPFFARGEMTGWFCFYELPRDQVARMLPPGLVLGHSPYATPGFHPVGLSLCKYHAVRGSFLPDFLAMPPYGEATFAIPYTCTAEGGRVPFLYPRRLYVSSKLAIFAGRSFYAMDKVDADIFVGDNKFMARNSKGLSIQARFEQHDDPVALSGHPAHGAISDLLDMSFVTRRSAGDLLYNAFNLQLDRCFVAPVTAEIIVIDADSGGFPAFSGNLRPLTRDRWSLPGAFRIWTSWSMTNPLDSKRVLQATEARYWLRKIA